MPRLPVPLPQADIDSPPATPDRRDDRCTSQVELCLYPDGRLGQVVDGTQLGSIATGTSWDELAARVGDELGALSLGQGWTQKLIGYRRRLSGIATALGRALFGHDGNALHRLLCTLHAQASASDGFVRISLASIQPELHNLPWELAAWSPDPIGADSPSTHLGTCPHLALSRRAYYDHGHVPDRTVTPSADVRILHITANRHERQYEHERIADHLRDMCSRHPRAEARAAYSENWANAPRTATPNDSDIDIFQLLTHGARVPGCLELAVAEHGDRNPDKDGRPCWSPGLEIDIASLVHLLGQERLPRLFILLSCWSFDHFGRRGAVADLLYQHGAAAAIGVLGELRLGKAAAVSRYLFSQLLGHGQIDLAVQRVRTLLMRYELGQSMRPDIQLPSDWFRPVLMTRAPQVCESFAHLPPAVHSSPQRGAEECVRKLLGTKGWQPRSAHPLADIEARRLDAVVDALVSGMSHTEVAGLLNPE